MYMYLEYIIFKAYLTVCLKGGSKYSFFFICKSAFTQPNLSFKFI